MVLTLELTTMLSHYFSKDTQQICCESHSWYFLKFYPLFKPSHQLLAMLPHDAISVSPHTMGARGWEELRSVISDWPKIACQSFSMHSLDIGYHLI